MDHRRIEHFFAIVAPGLEEVCARELHDLGLSAIEPEAGGVLFSGRLADLYRASLHVRTTSRIVVRFAEFSSRDFPRLFRQAVQLPWGRFLQSDRRVALRVTCRRSRLIHTERVAATLIDAINRALGRRENPFADGEQLVLARIIDDRVMISIDSSGELLHRRGYRQSGTVAPLRETLAAGVLLLAGWRGDEPLYDPMCGSGTFLAEGALLAENRAPGLNRAFAFMRWPGWREGLWRQLCQQAAAEQVEADGIIAGSDRDATAVAASRANIAALGLSERIPIAQRALAEQPIHTGRGLVVCNPPYGLRLAASEDLSALYREMGRELRRAFPDWRCVLLCADEQLAGATGLPLEQTAVLNNGGVKTGLFSADRI